MTDQYVDQQYFFIDCSFVGFSKIMKSALHTLLRCEIYKINYKILSEQAKKLESSKLSLKQRCTFSRVITGQETISRNCTEICIFYIKMYLRELLLKVRTTVFLKIQHTRKDQANSACRLNTSYKKVCL